MGEAPSKYPLRSHSSNQKQQRMEPVRRNIKNEEMHFYGYIQCHGCPEKSVGRLESIGTTKLVQMPRPNTRYKSYRQCPHRWQGTRKGWGIWESRRQTGHLFTQSMTPKKICTLVTDLRWYFWLGHILGLGWNFFSLWKISPTKEKPGWAPLAQLLLSLYCHCR